MGTNYLKPPLQLIQVNHRISIGSLIVLDSNLTGEPSISWRESNCATNTGMYYGYPSLIKTLDWTIQNTKMHYTEHVNRSNLSDRREMIRRMSLER